MATSRCSVVVYDDSCPLCTFQMRLITWLDWFSLTSFLPLSSPRAAELAAGIEAAALREAIHCFTPRGRVWRGARALRYLGLRLPLLVPFALVLWVPGVIFLAERGYAWVSRNRHLLSRLFGCREACAILPERRRAGDERVGEAAAEESPSAAEAGDDPPPTGSSR